MLNLTLLCCVDANKITIWATRASVVGCICRNSIGIAFQTTSKCGLNPICKKKKKRDVGRRSFSYCLSILQVLWQHRDMVNTIYSKSYCQTIMSVLDNFVKFLILFKDSVFLTMPKLSPLVTTVWLKLGKDNVQGFRFDLLLSDGARLAVPLCFQSLC